MTHSGGLVGNGSGGGVYVTGSIPAGLSDVSQLAPSFLNSSVPYSETHTINRSESNSVSLSQSGAGSSGAFTVTVTGSNKFSDTTSGSGGSGNQTETSSGSSSGSNTYKLVMSGTYANGTFTVTTETGSDSGNSSQNGTTTITNPLSDETSQEQDWTDSDNYTESWSGSNSGGQWTFSSYALTDTESVYDHTHTIMTAGGYQDQSYTTTMPLTANNASSYSADETLNQNWTNYYGPNSHYNQSQ